MVVFEHCHGREVVAVGVGAADEEGVFFGDPEAGGGFAGAGEGWRGFDGDGVHKGEEGGCSGDGC